MAWSFRLVLTTVSLAFDGSQHDHANAHVLAEGVHKTAPCDVHHLHGSGASALHDRTGRSSTQQKHNALVA